MGWWSFKPYVSVAQRRANAAKEVAKLAKKGQVILPVKLNGNKIATTFWGKAWCDNLEAYSDFASRLPRGRTYVRNGSVVDLQIKPGSITSLVSGSSLYRVKISIQPLRASTWKSIRESCAGRISSVIELLKGGISDHVMKIVTNQSTGLFPSPREIEMNCSCPDWAGMCKHVAATLYGVGARLDDQPELLFLLRQVDHLDLVAQAAEIKTLPQGAADAKTIAQRDLSDVFGIELNETPAAPVPVIAAKLVARKRPVESTNSVKKKRSPTTAKSVTKTTGAVAVATRVSKVTKRITKGRRGVVKGSGRQM